MKQKTIFKLISFAAMSLSGIATLLSAWADNKEIDAMIDEKLDERLADNDNEEKNEES